MTVYASGDGFKCHKCNIKGDSVEFVAYALCGERFSRLDGNDRDTVREWHTGKSYTVAVPVRAPEPPRYVDPMPLWLRCTPVGRHPFAVARGLQGCPTDLARLTPTSVDGWPEWWPAGRRRVWRLVTRGWTPEGMAVNLHGRAVVDPPVMSDGKSFKTFWAKGADSQSVVFWNQVRPDACDLVLIMEGMTDWLSAAMWAEGRGVAVYGATSGGFSAFRRIVVPDRVPIVVATHEDDAGHGYAREVAECYPERVRRGRVSRFVGEGERVAAK